MVPLLQLERFILVGDRGTLTQKRIEVDQREHEGLQWISTALLTPQIQALVAQGAIQMSLFDEQDLRVRAHVFLAMLAYYVEWHMRQALAPVLFEDEERWASLYRGARRTFRKSPKQCAPQA